MGLLVIRGTLRVAQFWPVGGNDADTASVEVTLSPKTAFTFVDDNGGRHPTRAFVNAVVMGKYGPMPVIKHDNRLNADKISVRLQGIDAPELHFQPTVSGSKGKNGKFRQNLGETCSQALYKYLSRLGQKDIPCEVLSRVRKPADVCDVYGRIVGNLIIGADGSRVDINHWVIGEGWAFPGFYNSMTKNEIRQLQADFAAAVADKRGIHSGQYAKSALAKFDPKRRYRKGPANFKPFSDKGAVNFPKFFRRQADHHVRLAVGTAATPAKFLDYVASKKDDIAIGVTAFLAQSSTTPSKELKKKFKQLATFVKNGRYPMGDDLVFWEADAKLLKATTNKPITGW